MNATLFTLLFFLPAGIANITPIIANVIPGLKRWKTPMDFGKSVNGKRLLGDNKTWRGLVTGTLAAGFAALVIYTIYPYTLDNLQFEASTPQLTVFIIGLIMGFGALLGDAVESFFKRRIGVEAGSSWFPFDQIDFIIGALVATSVVFTLQPQEYIFITSTYLILHVIVSYIGYLLKLKSKPI